MPAQPTSAPVESVANLADAQISRRTLAKGAAWSVPVIAAAIAAPAAVASTGTAVVGVGCTTSTGAVLFTVTSSPQGSTLPTGVYKLTVGTNLAAPAVPGNVTVSSSSGSGFNVSAPVGRELSINVTSQSLTQLSVNYTGKTIAGGNDQRNATLAPPSGASGSWTFPNGADKGCR